MWSSRAIPSVQFNQVGSFAAALLAQLRAENGKGRKQRRRVTQLYAELVKQGYAGSYVRVACFVRKWRQAQPPEF